MRVTHSTVASLSLEYSTTGVHFDLHVVKQNLFSDFGRSKKVSLGSCTLRWQKRVKRLLHSPRPFGSAVLSSSRPSKDTYESRSVAEMRSGVLES